MFTNKSWQYSLIIYQAFLLNIFCWSEIKAEDSYGNTNSEPNKIINQFIDNNLREAIVEILNKKYPTLNDIQNINNIELVNKNICNLEGLQYCLNLLSLDLCLNNITDLRSLDSLTKLKHLDLSHNEIRNIKSLAHLSALESMDLSANQISDITPLAGLHNLGWLDLGDNSITDLLPIVNLEKLFVLHVHENPLNEKSINQYIPMLTKVVHVTWSDPNKRSLSLFVKLLILTSIVILCVIVILIYLNKDKFRTQKNSSAS